MKRKQLLKTFLTEKAYYLAFGICLAAVAVSGWLFVRSLTRRAEPTQAPEAVEAAVLPTLPPIRQTPAQQLEDSPAVPVGRTEPLPEAGEPAEAAVTEPVLSERLRPLDGTVILGYSMDKLAYNPTTRDWRTHPGLDIAAPLGTEVRAAADGTVLAVYSDDLLGQTVTLEHPQGYVTHYANLSEELAVSVGEQVKAGQTLGTVGKTALAEIGAEPHLHFAVYRNKVPQDPAAFLAG